MKFNHWKRGICMVLALVMVLSMLPVHAFATETEHHDHTSDTEIAAEATESAGSVYQQLQEMTDALMRKHLGTVSMTDEMVCVSVEAMDRDSSEAAMDEIHGMIGLLSQLSEAELQAFADENPAFVAFSEKIMAAEVGEILPMAASGTVLNGQITVTDTASKVSVSGSTVTVTVKGSGGLTGGSTSSNTVTITNTSGNTAAVSFDYNCSATGTFTFSEGSNSGTWSGMLAAGEAVTMTMTATGGALFSSSTATLKLTNFSLTAAKDSSSVTVSFNSAEGGVTADGTAITSGTTLEGITPAEGVQLVATPAKGYSFACWIDPADGTIAAYEATYHLQPMEDVSVKALFVPTGGDAWFRIGKTLYYNLNAALAAAKSGDVIVLVSNGTLSAGEYTIPGGITLLIPFDEGGTVFTTAPESASSTTTPSAYRTLTLAAGANLTVNGTLSVAAKHYRSSGRPVGKYGYMVLKEGSNLKVNGKLYAYGFIGGKGNVKIMSGASVYEYFQIIDFRGGTATLGMYGNSKEVFPLSQYYVQNVEAPMTLEAGATEYGYTTLYMSSTEYHSTVKFIGTSGAMFNLTSGSVTKEYDGTTDRLLIRANGTMTLEPMSLSVSSMSINSKDYVLPINSSITIRLEGGTATVKQDLALQPNAELIVDQGATCVLASGVRLYVYDMDQWGSYVYSAAQLRVVPYAPGRTYKSATSSSRTITGDARIQVAGTLDASAGKLYTTQSGAAITGVEGGIVKMGSVSSGSTYQATQSGTSVSYDTIAVTSAKLQNEGGGYVATSANTYAYEDGAWGIYCAHSYTAVTVAATCTSDGSTTYTCGKCGRSYSETIPATGHKAGDAVRENVVAASCTEGGSYDSAVYCTVCGGELSRERITVPATGHNWNGGEITTAPGCESEGVKTYTCGLCGEKRTETVAALGHDMVYTPSKDATCTQDGEAAGAYCSRCDYVETSGGVIPALGHDWVETARVEATCTVPGSITYVCSRCGETRIETIDALGHAYTGVVTPPTCTEQGYTTYTCNLCGDSYRSDGVPAAGHSYQAVVTAPTCTEAGYTTYTCTVCGDSYVGDEISAAGHDYGDGSVTLIATCTTAGVRTYTCNLCGDSYEMELPALGHELKHHDAKLPSYTSVGWDAYEECSRCDYTTYHEYPILKREGVSDYETFLKNLLLLEQIADRYVEENPGGDPAALVLNYIRCGIASYTTTSWAIMAGNENTDFTAYVLAYEDAYNASVTDPEELISVVSIRNLKQFPAPSDPSFALEFTHMFGTMDITSHNPGSRDHADVAGWAGDLVDLLDLVDGKSDVKNRQTVEEMVEAIFAGDYIAGSIESFGRQDMYGDLDAFYIMRELAGQEYYTGLLTGILRGYFVEGLTDENRAAYFLKNRMDGITNRAALRAAVYNAYVGNRVNTTLEGTRTFVSDSEKLYDLRMAVCCAFADYLWRLAGDYVADDGNTEVLTGETVILAPGITRQTNSAAAADGGKLSYYVTTADLSREDVRIDSVVGAGTVLALAQGHEANVIAGINAGAIAAAGSYGDSAGLSEILTGMELVKEGRSIAAEGGVRNAGTAVGITRTGKTVFVTVDSATPVEIARIMLDAGCVRAYLLDSGSKTSYVSRKETEDTFTDHTENTEQVSSVLLMISNAANDTNFDHAVLRAEHTYLTVGTGVQITASGVTARGSEVDIPEGELVWSVSDETVGRVSGDGVFTAAAVGDAQVILSLNGEQIGSITVHVVIPDTLYFTTGNINAYFGEAAALPLAALYQRKPVAISERDVTFAVSANDEGVSGGSVSGFDFVGDEESGLKTVTVTAALAANVNVSDTITVTMYNQGDVVFDFDQATGGDRSLAWLRGVSNATTEDGNTYHVVDPAAVMVTDYTFAIDMSAIAVPEQLKELTNMLPGADQTDGTAWGFLLQLADRISVLSEVSAAIQVDPNFNVDLSGLSLQNEYFTLSSAELDPGTNVLNVKLNWVKQSAAIEPATANPICVVSGIALTPKADAAWDENSTLTPVNSAVLSYAFYLSAGALYTFAGDPTNQAAYGLSPYINPDNSSDRGASFGADYASFSDSYTLVNALKNGWYFEEGQNVFYVDGVLHTIHTPMESVTTPPGCTEGGYTTHVCAVCGITYVSDETAALGHSAGEISKENEVAPDCTAEGSYDIVVRCDICGEELSCETVVVPALGHVEEIIPAVEATCTETGLTEGKKCSVCGEILVEQEIVAALGHTEEIVPAVAATCTESGLTEGKKCSVCSEILVGQEVVAALGHTEEIVPAVAATCTESGLTEGKKCAACGETLVAQEVVDALGHTEEIVPAVDATCTESGLTDGKKCSACGETLVAQEVVAALGHTEAIVPAVAATCTETGLTEGKKCSVCGETLVAQEVVAALGHTEEIVPAVAATCTESGLTEGKVCSVCGDTLVAQEVVAALGHTEEIVPAVAATCTETGLTEGKKCAACGETLVEQEVVAALGHTEAIVPAVAATCTETGLTEGKKCSVCGETLVEQEVVAALGHDYESVITAPTCTEGGYTTYTCSVCGDSYVGDEIAALGHTEEIIPAVEATCTETGLTEGKKCSVCGETLVAQEVVAALGHDYETVITAPTCTEGGYTTYTCTVCGDTYVADEVAALGHTEEIVPAVAATCTESGLTEGKKCSVCGETLVAQEVVAALGHTEEIVPAVAATCTETGLTEGKKCAVCGEILVGQEVVAALGHTEEIVPAVAATCTESGLTEGKVCSVCGETLVAQEVVAALGHTEEIVPAVAATCTESGLTDGKKCSVCGETLVAQEVVAALGHTEEIVPAVAATCTESGLTEGKKCSVCGETLVEQEVVAALGHTEEIVPAVAASCTENGLTEGKKCSVCGEILVAQEIVDALGHDYETVVTAPTCAKDGYTTYTCSVCGDSYVADEVAALGHTEEVIPAVEATCTETGLSEGKKCAVCGETLVAQEVVAALGHTEEIVPAVAASCTENGLTEGKKCSVCGETLVGQEIVAALGHTEEIVPAVAATCTETGLTEGKKCSVCGETLVAQEVVAALGHTEEIVPAVAATCTESGLTEGKKCSVCGETLVEQGVVDALGHTEEIIPAVDATCTESGLTDGKKCSACGETLVAQEVVAALGHTEEIVPAVAATCTESGLTEGKVCSVCGETLVEQEVVAALGHTEEIVPAVAATCTETGLSEGKKCAACGETLVAQEVVAALGHTEEIVPAVAATCTESGLTEGKKCAVCGEILVEQEIVAALGHTEEIVPAVAATCTESGLTEGKVCSVCGEILVAQEVVAALGHTEEIVPAVAATCTESGLTEGKVCSVCGEILVAQEVVAALGHTEEIVPAVAASCTENGLTEGKKCAVCGETLVEQEVVAALGHTEEIVPAVAATCTESGLTEGKVCSVCGEILVAQEVVAALGHTEEIVPAVAATCTESGLTEGKVCSVCGEILVAQEVVAALGHTEEIVPAVAATCTESGLTEGKKCSVCSEILVAQEVVAALGHTEEIVPAVAATCTETGLTEGKKCAACGETLVEQEIVAALGHTEEIVPAVAATCTESGLTEGKKCAACGETLVTQEVVAALGHDYETVITAPTCTEVGYTTYTCSVCGDTYVADEVAALGHTEEIIPAVAATCTETGLTEGKVCSVCGEILVGQEVVAALGHTEEIVPAVAATCTESGLTEGKKCSVCGETLVEQEVVAALGHTEEIVPAVAATCTETGLTEGKKCSACGETLVAQEVVAALGHTEEIVPAVAATCTESGLTEGKKCAACGETLVAQEVVAALGHAEEIVPAVAATCTESGLTEGKKCSVCSEILVEQEIVAALGHTEEIVPAVAATCTESGLTEGKKCSVCGETLVEQEEIPALGHEWKGTGCSRCDETRANPFVDVKETDYFIAPVLWAVEQGITAGVSADRFGPDNACTRGQVVTFLWRAVGSPEPATTANPFQDVKVSDYFYKAVLWAYESGITAGSTPGYFNPNGECTRAQVVTFLWRAMGSPAASTEVAFGDVAAGQYYYTPVAWAVENGITAGVGNGLFGVDNVCTRAQVVTFLYRTLA